MHTHIYVPVFVSGLKRSIRGICNRLLVKRSASKPEESKIVRAYIKLTLKEAVDVAKGKQPTSQFANLVKSRSQASFGGSVPMIHVTILFALTATENIIRFRSDLGGENGGTPAAYSNPGFISNTLEVPGQQNHVNKTTPNQNHVVGEYDECSNATIF